MPSSEELKKQNELIEDQQNLYSSLQSSINNAASAASRLTNSLQGAVNYANQLGDDMSQVAGSTAEASQHANTLGSNLAAAMQSGIDGLKNLASGIKGSLLNVGSTTASTITSTFGDVGSIVQNTFKFAIPAAMAGFFQVMQSKYQQTFKEVRAQLGSVFTDPQVNNNVNKYFINLEGRAIRSNLSFTELITTSQMLTDSFGVAASKAAQLSFDIADGAKAIGVQATTMATVMGNLQLVSDLTLEQSHQLSEQTALLAAQNDVAPQQIMRDIAESTEDMAKFSASGVKNFIKSAIQARKLGMSIKDVANTMDGLLNFEDSLNKELQASVMLGRRINLNEARRAAFAGDTAGAMEAVVKELGDIDLQGLDPLTLQAVAQSAGLSVTQLQKLSKGADDIVGKDVGEAGMEAFSTQSLAAKNAMTDMELVMTDIEAHMRQIAGTDGEKFVNLIKMSSGFMKDTVTGMSAMIGRIEDLMAELNQSVPYVKTELESGEIELDFFAKGTYGQVLTDFGKEIAMGTTDQLLKFFGSGSTAKELTDDLNTYFTQIEGQEYSIFGGLLKRLEMLFTKLFIDEEGPFQSWLSSSPAGQKVQEFFTSIADTVQPTFDTIMDNLSLTKLQAKLQTLQLDLSSFFTEAGITNFVNDVTTSFTTAFEEAIPIIQAKIESMKIDITKIFPQLGTLFPTLFGPTEEEKEQVGKDFDELFGPTSNNGTPFGQSSENFSFQRPSLPPTNDSQLARNISANMEQITTQQKETNRILAEHSRLLNRILSDGINVQRA